MYFFLAVFILIPFSFCSDRQASSDPFRNKEQTISHHCYWYISLLLIDFLYYGVFPRDLFFPTYFAINRLDSGIESELRNQTVKLVSSVKVQKRN